MVRLGMSKLHSTLGSLFLRHPRPQVEIMSDAGGFEFVVVGSGFGISA